MDFFRRHRFKQEIIRLFEKHQDKLIADSGFAVQALHGAETNVYALAYQYCCDNNLHLSCIQKIKWYFKEWVDDMDTDRLMRVW
ncbi:MAG TPA: hypothetical protein VGB71_16590 [Flavisolibacter sp.]|jgi:hypothetical protein